MFRLVAIGKGVMEALEAIPLPTGADRASPLLSELDPRASNDSLWTRLLHGIEMRLLPNRSVGLSRLSAICSST